MPNDGRFDFDQRSCRLSGAEACGQKKTVRFFIPDGFKKK
jgi:hypothetical protein